MQPNWKGLKMAEAQIPHGYKQTEVGMIPEDWEVRPLVGFASILHGYGFQSQYFNPMVSIG